MRRILMAGAIWLLMTALAPAQDRVQYRERGAKGGVQTASGKIEAESIAGVKVGAKSISSGDIIEVQLEVPGELRIDYNRALGEEAKNPANAIKELEALSRNQRVQGIKSLKTQIDYKIAAITAARADDSAEAMVKAIDLLNKFLKDHPDSWQAVPVSRILGRLLGSKDPPDFEGARKVYEQLASATGLPPEVKQDCNFLAIDLLLRAGKVEEAQSKIKAIPSSDPRVRLYEIGAKPGSVDDVIKQLEEFAEKTNDTSLRAAAYNMIGDVYRRDAARRKDALYAFLKVDLIYNQDPAELQKAQGRIAELFQEMKDDDRARKYREKSRGK